MTDLQIKVYRLLRTGVSQSQIANDAGIPAGTVSKIARKLLRGGFLTLAHDKHPKLYDKGPKSEELESLIVKREGATSDSDDVSRKVSIYTTGVRKVSTQSHVVPTIRAHHYCIRFHVEKYGDISAIKVLKDGAERVLPLFDKMEVHRRNVTRRSGRVILDGERYTVKLEETPNFRWFYVYPPPVDLTEDQLKKDPGVWDKIAAEKAQKLTNFVAKHGRWQFGIMEVVRGWKPQFAHSDPRVLKGVVKGQTAISDSGEIYLSDSEGEDEFETTNAKKAVDMVNLPEKVTELRVQVDGRFHSLDVRLDHLITLLDKIIEAQEKDAEAWVNRAEKDAAQLLGLANGNGRRH